MTLEFFSHYYKKTHFQTPNLTVKYSTSFIFLRHTVIVGDGDKPNMIGNKNFEPKKWLLHCQKPQSRAEGGFWKLVIRCYDMILLDLEAPTLELEGGANNGRCKAQMKFSLNPYDCRGQQCFEQF